MSKSRLVTLSIKSDVVWKYQNNIHIFCLSCARPNVEQSPSSPVGIFAAVNSAISLVQSDSTCFIPISVWDLLIQPTSKTLSSLSTTSTVRQSALPTWKNSAGTASLSARTANLKGFTDSQIAGASNASHAANSSRPKSGLTLNAPSYLCKSGSFLSTSLQPIRMVFPPTNLPATFVHGLTFRHAEQETFCGHWRLRPTAKIIAHNNQGFAGCVDNWWSRCCTEPVTGRFFRTMGIALNIPCHGMAAPRAMGVAFTGFWRTGRIKPSSRITNEILFINCTSVTDRWNIEITTYAKP